MEYIILLLSALAIFIAPLNTAANIVGAKNTNLIACIVAFVLAAIIHRIVVFILSPINETNSVIYFIAVIAPIVFSYKFILATSYIRAILIAIIQIILIAVILFILSLLGVNVSITIY